MLTFEQFTQERIYLHNVSSARFSTNGAPLSTADSPAGCREMFLGEDQR
jgi:hypothetical protein